MRKWLIGIAILAVYAALLAVGPLGPLWVKAAGFSVFFLYLVAGSVYLAIRFARGERIEGPQLGLFPKSWQRWMLDEPDPKLDPRRGAR